MVEQRDRVNVERAQSPELSFQLKMMPPSEGERWWSVISVKLEVSYAFSIYFWLFIKACLCQVVILWPSSVVLSLGEILHSAISALLLSLNQSSRLALLSDRGRTLSRPWWRLREMYICRSCLISPVNIMQGSVVLMLRTERRGKCCRKVIIYND